MRLLYIALISFLAYTISFADVIDFSITMNGSQEVPSNGSSGTGGEFEEGCFYDTETNILTIEIQYSGLSSNTNNAHIHGPAAVGVSTGPVFGLTGFVLGSTSGNYSHTFSLSESQEADLLAELYYINIHTINFGGGEIRGQLINEGVLPVELVSFSASVEKDFVRLSWVTATEVENYGFEIQKIKDSKIERFNDWESISFIKGNGNSNSVKHYSFIDKEISFGSYLYRLKQIDNDGSFDYSKVVVASFRTPDKYALEQNFPNPFNPTTKILYSIPFNSFVTIKIFDIQGREIQTLINEQKDAGYYEVELNGSSLASGLYFYKLISNGYEETKKLLLLK